MVKTVSTYINGRRTALRDWIRVYDEIQGPPSSRMAVVLELGRRDLTDDALSLVSKKGWSFEKQCAVAMYFQEMAAGLSYQALVHKLRVPDVECFSYANGDPQPNGDPYIAREMAHQLGYRHTVVTGYQDQLDSNAELGQGLAPIIHEVDAWKELSNWFSQTEGGALFVGDMAMGGSRRHLPFRSDFDVIRLIFKRDITDMSWLDRVLPNQQLTAFKQATSLGYSEILGRCPPAYDYYNKWIYLYLDQALRKNFAFRENLAGPFIKVRSPLLDNNIIDFMMAVPCSLRRNNRLYKSTVNMMFPDLFKFKRAITSGFSNYSWERSTLRLHHPEIEDFVSNQDSPLDEFIPSNVILDLLKEQPASLVRTNRGLRGIVRSSRLKVLNSSIAKWGIRKWPGTRSYQGRIRQATFLISALYLRLYLHKRLSKRSPARSEVVV